MKTPHLAFWMLALSLTFLQTACITNDEICDGLEKADLFIPKVLKLYNHYGQPLFDNLGNHVEGFNEVYLNERTGEIFTPTIPPSLPLQIGDYIQLASNVVNDFHKILCLAPAAPSYALPTLSVSDVQGTQVFQSNQASYTPSIPEQGRAATVTRFQLFKQGYYKVNWLANHDKDLDEHTFTNNDYIGNDGGLQGLSKGSGFEVFALTNPTTKIYSGPSLGKNNPTNTVSGYEQSALIQFMKDPQQLTNLYRFKQANPNLPFILDSRNNVD